MTSRVPKSNRDYRTIVAFTSVALTVPIVDDDAIYIFSHGDRESIFETENPGFGAILNNSPGE